MAGVRVVYLVRGFLGGGEKPGERYEAVEGGNIEGGKLSQRGERRLLSGGKGSGAGIGRDGWVSLGVIQDTRGEGLCNNP